MKVFLLTFNGDRQPILDFLDQQPIVLNWFAIFPGAILITSESDATTLAQMIHPRFPSIFFVITEVDTLKTNGWATPTVWDFVNSPKSSGRWDYKPGSLPPWPPR